MRITSRGLAFACITCLSTGCSTILGLGNDFSTGGDGGDGRDATSTDGPGPEASSSDGPPGDTAPSEAGPPTILGFQPSNIDLTGIDVSGVKPQDVTTKCEIDSEPSPFTDCFVDGFTATVVKQSDGSSVTVVVVKSLTIEAQGQIVVAKSLPLVIVALSDVTIHGSVDAHSQGDTAAAGGFSQQASNAAGTGPGGGPAATATAPGVAAGGGSYCGKGGPGAAESGGGAPGTPAASYGSAELRPLQGGSSGGGGEVAGAGAGGGAVQIVAGGTLTMSAGSFVNAGGGGGLFGGTMGQNAAGGGSGGAILLEAPTLSLAGTLAANGGGGGGSGDGTATAGADATANASAAAAGTGPSKGGPGSAGASTNGAPGTDTAGKSAGGGGGAAGRIRVNSKSGSPDLSRAIISPDASTTCVSVGTLRTNGSPP